MHSFVKKLARATKTLANSKGFGPRQFEAIKSHHLSHKTRSIAAPTPHSIRTPLSFPPFCRSILKSEDWAVIVASNITFLRWIHLVVHQLIDGAEVVDVHGAAVVDVHGAAVDMDGAHIPLHLQTRPSHSCQHKNLWLPLIRF
ncbi:hypothetical protein ACS0TY_034225 [Phlomoides rotata]